MSRKGSGFMRSWALNKDCVNIPPVSPVVHDRWKIDQLEIVTISYQFKKRDSVIEMI